MYKACTGCGESKPLDGFYRKATGKDGRASRCKVCHNAVVKQWERDNPENIKARTYRWREKYPEKAQAIQRRSQLKRNYGVTVEQYETQLASQGGVCAICKGADPKTRWGTFCVDHDHGCCPGGRSCGKCVRGVVCGNCNAILGMSGDSPEILRVAIEYLGGAGWFPQEVENTVSSIPPGSGCIAP